MRLWLGTVAACPLAGVGVSKAAMAIDHEVFEDADCLEDESSEVLMELMSELGDVLDKTLQEDSRSEAWDNFRQWRSQRAQLLLQLTGAVFARPYCEPGKVAGTTATCLLLLDAELSPTHLEHAFSCVQEVEAQLQDTVPEGADIYTTRVHMFLRSPWPAFRLLDLLVRLWPDKDAVAAARDMGACEANKDWLGRHVDFDWEWFKGALDTALSTAIANPRNLALDPSDGPLSEQYRARWARIYRIADFTDSAAFSGDCFYKFRRNQWEAGCHPAVVTAYLMQVLTFSIRDTDAWLQRYIGAAWRLLNLLTPLTSLIRSDWPVFRALYLGSLLRRRPAPQTLEDFAGRRAERGPTRALEKRLEAAFAHGSKRIAYVSAAWGALASPEVLGAVLSRWRALELPRLILLAMDANAAQVCTASGHPGLVECVEVPQRFGIEALVAKYIALAFVAQLGTTAVWLDLDVYLPRDPTSRVEEALANAGSSPIALAGFQTSQSLSPSVLVARAGQEASDLLIQYAAWLHENPYILDHQGWDAFVQNRDGDFSGGWDYKGRNISMSTHANDGLELSFAPSLGPARRRASPRWAPRFARLGPEFGSADGWRGSVDGLAAFHFWGASEGQRALFDRFYPYESRGFTLAAQELLARYRRTPSVGGSAPSVRARAHVTAVSYADGCCAKSIERNYRSALSVGVDVAHAYGRSDLDPMWASRNEEVLSQRKGAGWWLWKPHMILRTLEDTAVPWHSGVVLWLDAGNFYVGDPQPVIARALRDSDVAAMRLKCCMENDWTSDRALRRLGGSGYAIADRPQLGAYFIMFRKTALTLDFVAEWLRLSEEPEIIMEQGAAASRSANANYQRHMADQSVFSVLFKQRGFQAMTLQEGHQVVQLDRWRE